MKFSIDMPDLNGSSSADNIQRLKSWITQLTEQLTILFNNINADNMGEDMVKLIDKGTQTEQELSEQRKIIKSLKSQLNKGSFVNEVSVTKPDCSSKVSLGFGYTDYANRSKVHFEYAGAVGDLWMDSFGRLHFNDAYSNWPLWSGAMYMLDSQTATLAHNVSEQLNGIVLIFSKYDYINSHAVDSMFSTFFVPKYAISQHEGKSFCFHGFNTQFVAWSKFLFIHDDKIVGYENNDDYGTLNGITYDNRTKVLRYVIGV